MPRTFLGKSIPNHQPPIVPFKRRRPSFLLYYLGPLVMILAFVLINIDSSSSNRNTHQASIYLNRPSTSGSRILADGFEYTNPCRIKDDKGVLTELGESFKPVNVFPLLPQKILRPVSGPVDDKKDCTPSNWTFEIYQILAWKILIIFNWLAGTLAILLTIYAGLLYIGGFANEGNIKKAKSILIATYIGLILVIMARVILYGTISVFSNKGVDPNDIQSIIKLPE